MMRSILALQFILLLALAGPAGAWSNKEHIQMTRLSAQRLIDAPDTPEAMKQWLGEIIVPTDMEKERDYFLHKRIGIIPRDIDGVAYWSTVPDMMALMQGDRKIEPYGVHERLLHYIDLELLAADESRRVYQHDLSTKPALADIPRDMSDPRWARAGMLPFRVEECYGKLVQTIRDGRLTDKAGQYPRDDHAAKWAGYLAHYVQDNTQPHHATIDYKSQSYFPSRRNPPNIHVEMEYKMGDDEYNDFSDLRRDFWPLFVAALEQVEEPVQTADLWQATVEVALHSYDALPLIGQAAQAAAAAGGRFDTESFMRHQGEYRGQRMTTMQMKARQMAWAVHRVEKLWRRAWEEAHAAPATRPSE